MNIYIITKNYPTKSSPSDGAFVANIAKAFQKLAPTHVINPRKTWESPNERLEVPSAHPWFPSFSNKRLSNTLNSYRLTNTSFDFAAARALAKKVKAAPPKLFYGHFLYPSGRFAVEQGKKYGTPSVIALGESDIQRYEPFYSKEEIIRPLVDATLVVCVSNKIKNYVDGLTNNQAKTLYLPNGVDKKVFYPREKKQMRQKHGLPEDQFLVCHVGQKTYRKGGERVAQALREIPGVSLIFLGEGHNYPNSNILLSKKTSSVEVAKLLCASDLFVIPTLSEGSCNAIIEAAACRVPTLTSSLAENHEILKDSGLYLSDPEDCSEIQKTVSQLKDAPSSLESIRKKMDKLEIMGIDERIKEIYQKTLSCFFKS